VIVDPTNQIAETNEENNEATRSVLVGTLVGYGDIEVAPEFDWYISYPSCWVTVSGTATYNLVYESSGEIETIREPVAGADVTLTISGQEDQWETHTLTTGHWGVELFAPDSAGDYIVTVEVTDYTFWEKVEYQLTVIEWPEGPGGEPAEGADLTIMRGRYPQIYFNSSKPVENDNVMITAKVFNIGTIGAADVLVNFYEGGALIGQRTIDYIPARENRSTAIWWKASSAGMHIVTVRVDPYDTIVELNENNNDGSKKVYVYPAWPDLTPTMDTRSFSDSTPVVNQLITIPATVTNIGGDDANDVLVRFYDNDTYIGKHIIPWIPGKHASRTALISHSFTTAGVHVIKVVVDPENRIMEATEDNNEYSVRIHVHLPSVDLTFPSYVSPDILWDIGLSKPAPTIVDVVTVSCTILNVGELEANNIVVEFLDNGAEFDSLYIPSIPSGSSETVSVSWIATPIGWHSITVVIDPDNTIDESNEHNNVAIRDVYVYPLMFPSDLYIHSEDIVFSNTHPDPGEEVTIYATVHNEGPEPAQNIPVVFLVDGREIGSETIPLLPVDENETLQTDWIASRQSNGSHLVKVFINPRYPIYDPFWFNNNATRAIIVGMLPKAPPVAIFTYNPNKPLTNETVTFCAIDSYDPDGGAITNYRWEFYRKTESPPFPSIHGPIEGVDQEIANYSFSSVADYLVNLTVTDDEGATNSTSVEVRVTNEWSFAIITDLHIGRRGYPEAYEIYEREPWEDAEEVGQRYYLTERLKKVVEWIKINRDEYNIRFVMVLGDLANNGEISEMMKAKEILDGLEETPYFPVIGNHDVWSWTGKRKEKPLGDSHFEEIFDDEFFVLQSRKLGVIVKDDDQPMLQNYAFNYRGTNFICMDCVPRNTRKARTSEAVLHEQTALFLQEWLQKGRPTFLFSHHPMVEMEISGYDWAFDDELVDDLGEMINAAKRFGTEVLANFAGHVHGFYGYDWLPGISKVKPTISMDANMDYREWRSTPADIPVITTEAMMVGSNDPTKEKGVIRIVEMVDGEIKESSAKGVFPALNPHFRGVDLNWLLPGNAMVEFDVYAFTNLSEPHCYDVTYIMDFGEEGTNPKEKLGKRWYKEDFDIYTVATGGEVEFWNVYEIADYYFVTLTARGKTPEGEIFEESVTLRIAVPTTVKIRFKAKSPVDIAVTDPEGFTISKEVNEIPGAFYFEIDLDEDGEVEDLITLPEYKIGDYIVTVIPEPDAAPTDTYTLEVSGEDVTIVLAEDVPVSDIPAEPYTLSSTALDVPPTTLLDVGEPKFVVDDVTCLTSEALVTLTAEDNPGGSGVASTVYRISNASFSSGWITYTQSFCLSGLSDGVYSMDYNSTDNAGNVEPTNTATFVLDNAGPSITVLNPPAGWVLQDEVTFMTSAIDAGSGVFSLNFSIREANGGQGTSVGFDDLQATYNATTGKWSLSFETLLLPDGYYVVLVEASDNLGNIGSTVVPYSIRNWAVVELLPASENNRAGRTMPVKFALRVTAEVDPLQPFVYNEELTIEIYATNNSDEILQESTFGDTTTDYRISSVHYITNFKTLKKPMQHTVTVYRNTFDIGSFTFKTKK